MGIGRVSPHAIGRSNGERRGWELRPIDHDGMEGKYCMDAKNKIRSFFVRELEEMGGDGSRLDTETHLIDGGILDSLTILNLISFLEDEFGVLLNEEEISPENLKTIQEISNLVARKSANVSKSS